VIGRLPLAAATVASLVSSRHFRGGQAQNPCQWREINVITDASWGYIDSVVLPATANLAILWVILRPPGGIAIRSRASFNRADGGPACPGLTNYTDIWLWATHSAIGGAPWMGDTPVGHSQANDNVMAAIADTGVRNSAIAAGVSLSPLPAGGYGY